MHRPIVRTLLKEAGASGEEADALAAEVFEACHEETEHMMLKQRKNISVIGTLEEHVGSDLMLDMGVLSKAVFAKCASEILPAYASTILATKAAETKTTKTYNYRTTTIPSVTIT